ncbi:MAG: hypothetical protein LBL36_03325 [Clostridiales Family XIII bacterium]|jgi:hypothetical protein|nr:hypothetical protein [Clostridiales Family XIII bacterium]
MEVSTAKISENIFYEQPRNSPMRPHKLTRLANPLFQWQIPSPHLAKNHRRFFRDHRPQFTASRAAKQRFPLNVYT